MYTVRFRFACGRHAACQLPPCGSYKASDTELKQWALDNLRGAIRAIKSARQHTTAADSEEGTRWPIGRARRHILASSASAASLVDAELSVYLQADVISQAEPPTEWWAANAARYPLLAAEAKRYLSDCKNRIGIGDRK